MWAHSVTWRLPPVKRDGCWGITTYCDSVRSIMAMSGRSDGSWQLLFHLFKVPSNKTYARRLQRLIYIYFHLVADVKHKSHVSLKKFSPGSRRLNWTTTPVLNELSEDELVDDFLIGWQHLSLCAAAVCFVLTLAWRAIRQNIMTACFILFISLKTFSQKN